VRACVAWARVFFCVFGACLLVVVLPPVRVRALGLKGRERRKTIIVHKTNPQPTPSLSKTTTTTTMPTKKGRPRRGRDHAGPRDRAQVRRDQAPV
jgi:hypothetical protein